MEIEMACGAFGALSQETRLGLLKDLIRQGPSGLSAGDLADRFAATAPTMSFHLKALSQAGLIRSRREGRSIFYAADYGGLRALVDFLMSDCCQGDPRLCGPYVINKEKLHEPSACAPQS